MTPLLYYDERSPAVRSCLMLIEILQINVKLYKIDIFKGEQFEEKFKLINPAHTVPTLVDDDLILTDSHAILIHFCEKYPTGIMSSILWPIEYKERMQILNILLFEMTFLYKRNLMSEIVHKGYKNVDIDYYRRKIFDAYDILEQLLRQYQRKFLASQNNFTIADISAVSAISTLDLLFFINENQWPLLNKWFESMKTLSVYEINRKGLEYLKITMEEIGQFKYPLRVSDNSNK